MASGGPGFRGGIRPGRPVAFLGMIFGAGILIAGIASGALGAPGAFGVVWVLMGLAVVGINAYYAFARKPRGVYELDVETGEQAVEPNDFESRLRKLEGLRRDGLISEEEFDRKREEILAERW